MKYPVVIHKDQGSDYGVTVPDIPGCYTAASSMEEAIEMIQEAIKCHIEGLLLDSDPVPLSSAIEQHQKNLAFKNGVWAMVDVDISKLSVKSRRVNITVPENLLSIMDQYAKKHGESRSGLLAQAVTEYMAVHH
ncbi:MAG: type II toxin-antitoxin system HicB family antitoxin [Gammaproteobacteria bacterium]|nr:type II toxin-antitoxin system HicB family antitoxin [Gammaproteobacteria bacterium]